MTKAHYHRQFNFALDSVDDADIIELIASQPSQIAYLRNLIRRDIRDERENDKLRKLLRAAYRCTNAGPNCLECRIVAGGCTLLSAMREMGIEVPR